MSSSLKSEILESLGKNLPGLIFYRFIRRKGKDLECDYISESIFQLIGVTAENVKKNPAILRTCILPEYIPTVKENTENSFKTLCNFNVDIEVQSINNGVRWMKVVCIPEVHENGDVVWFGIQTDITEEKKTNEKLFKFNHELKLLNNIYDIIITNKEEQTIYDLICKCLVEKGGYKLAWLGHQPDPKSESQIVKHISAYGETEYLKKIKIDLNDPLMKVGPTATVLKNGGCFINNDAANNFQFIPWHEIAAEFNIRSSIVLELDIIKDSKSVLNIYSANVNAFDDDEVLILKRIAKGISSAVKNAYVEKEKEIATRLLNTSEANLKSIFEHTEVGYILLDLNFNTISLNQSFFSIFKLKNSIELKANENFLQQLGPEKASEFSEAISKAIRTESTVEYEKEFILNKHKYYYFTTIIPVRNETGIIGICISKFDITKRKNEELTRIKITDELLQRNRDLEQFAYIISHNLRAPVVNILGLNLLLNENPNHEEKQMLLSKLNSSTLRLDEVIKDLNNILQIRREVSELRTEIDFKVLVDNVLESISSIISNNNVELDIDFTEAPKAHLIRTYIGSVFYNLITNSIKYADAKRRIKIKIRSTYSNNNLVITYQDNGIGIDLTKYKDQVFGLYKRFNNDVEGKGLGLFMVKTQIEVMGGTISIESTVNVGTTFKIQFPKG